MQRIGSILAAVVIALASATPSAGERPPLAMLDQLQAGRWELRVRGEAQVERLCLRSGRPLIQLRHRRQNCDRLIVEDEAGRVTVQYICRGRGYGRTQIRRESDSLVQIDSQGIEGGLPFAFAAEARRIGDCV